LKGEKWIAVGQVEAKIHVAALSDVAAMIVALKLSEIKPAPSSRA
jgi:hypothetical protein